MMTAKEIIRAYCQRLSPHPDYYSGRGATVGDLNSEMLGQLHAGIVKEIGQKAGEQFLDMVSGIDVLSATLFLNSLFALEANKWKWKKRKKESKANDHIEITSSPDPDEKFVSGMVSLESWLGGGSMRDETPLIRDEFLIKHGRASQAGQWPGMDRLVKKYLG